LNRADHLVKIIAPDQLLRSNTIAQQVADVPILPSAGNSAPQSSPCLVGELDQQAADLPVLRDEEPP
jgi:hypothetical protein